MVELQPSKLNTRVRFPSPAPDDLKNSALKSTVLFFQIKYVLLVKRKTCCKMRHMITIDQKIAELLNNWVYDGWPIGNFVACVIALVLCVVLCGAIGLERERRGRSAGLRTHMLVGAGSCLVMIISIYGFPQLFSEKRDVARLAAQVITGVGFLGAGAIIHRNSGVRGLTTAATIWIVMAIGICCGSFNFILATGGTLLIILVLTLFRKLENRLNKKAPLISIKANPDFPIVSNILSVSQKYEFAVEDLRVDKLDDSQIEVTFLAVNKTSEPKTDEYIEALKKIEGANIVGIMNGHISSLKVK